MSLFLHGIGTALPEAKVPQTEARRAIAALIPALAEASWLDGMYTHSGINTRHTTLGRPFVDDMLHHTRTSDSAFLPNGCVLGPTTGQRMEMYADAAPKLAVSAARDALARAHTDPKRITHLITVSCTGFMAPGLDRSLIVGLGLPATVERTHVGYMGCHGAINGLRAANAYATADPNAVVLTVAVELCTLHYDFRPQPEHQVGNALFADGAAAVVGSSAGDGPAIVAAGSCLLPESADAMTWTVGDHGFEMMLSRRIPGLIARHLGPWLDTWLGKNNLTRSQVGSWAVHPGGPRILTAVKEGLDLPAGALAMSRGVLADYGNMSSPTVLFIVRRLLEAQAALPCVILGFGPGLTAEALLVA